MGVGDGHVELGIAGVRDAEDLALATGGLALLHADEAADAVFEVDDEVAGDDGVGKRLRHVGLRGDLARRDRRLVVLARREAQARTLGAAVEVGLGEEQRVRAPVRLRDREASGERRDAQIHGRGGEFGAEMPEDAIGVEAEMQRRLLVLVEAQALRHELAALGRHEVGIVAVRIGCGEAVDGCERQRGESALRRRGIADEDLPERRPAVEGAADGVEAAVDGDAGVLREGLRLERDLLMPDPEDGGVVGDRLVQHRRGGAADHRGRQLERGARAD